MGKPKDRRLAAVMFCDMVGFTAAMQEDEQAALASRDRYRTIIEDLHGEFGGEIVQYYGDGTLSIFSSSVDAVRCAVAIQQTLSEEPSVRVRVGVHVGDVVVEDHGLLGDAVNVASRIESFGQPGAVLVSDSVHDLVKNQPDMELVSLGEFHLDNVARPHGLFAVDGERLVVPDAASLTGKGRRVGDPVRSNLPVQVTSFVGRVQESAELEKLIRGSRLVTVTGAGGCGKSRMAVEVAAGLTDDHADGVWLVELAPLSDDRLVASTVANVLGVREQPGMETLDVLTGFLSEKALLLVVDNSEHLIESVAELVAYLLAHTTGLRVVATSREPLHVRGEAVYHLPTLPVPDLDDDWETLIHTDSVRLFAERAEAAHPGFRVTHDNGEAVASICLHLDGIPLAVELAAAATRMLTPEDIDERLDDRFRLLRGGARDDVEYHRTLEAAIDWSFQLLTPDQQTVFARLAVFAGSFDVEAAEQVCGDNTHQAGDMLVSMVELADRSILESDDSESGIRFRMLETVRTYGEQRLADTGEEQSLRTRHATFFAALAEDAFPAMWGPDEVEWTKRLEEENDNLRQALSWLISSGDTQTGLAMGGALYRFWGRRSRMAEGLIWLWEFLDRDETPSSARARALQGAALFEGAQGRAGLLLESLALYRQFGPEYELIGALNNLAVDHRYRGDWKASAELLSEQLQLSQAGEDHSGEAFAAKALSIHFAHVVDDLEPAETYANQAVDAARRSESPELEALALAGLADICRFQGDLERAEVLFQQTLAIEGEIAGTLAPPLGRVGLALTYHDMGDYDRSLRYMTQSLEETRRWLEGTAGWSLLAIENLRYMGLIYAARGEGHRATVILSAAESGRFETGEVPKPRDHAWLDRTVALLEETLEPDAFHSAWNSGFGMTSDDTFDYALNLLDDA